MRSTISAILVVVVALVPGCGGSKQPSTNAPPAKLVSLSAPPSGSAAIAIANDEGEDGQWSRPAKDYASSRYSKLDQINARNVGNLRVSFTFSTAVNRGHEAAPLVLNNTMYVVTPY